MNQIEVTTELFQQWCQHPITNKMLNIISEHRKTALTCAMKWSRDSKINAEEIKRMCVIADTADALLEALTTQDKYNTESK